MTAISTSAGRRRGWTTRSTFSPPASPGCSCAWASRRRIFRRDRKRHKSPNSAHTEAACAGALQLQLAGPNYYFGQLVDKPTIGDDQRPVEALDILRAGRILYATAFFALLLFCGVPLLILLFP